MNTDRIAEAFRHFGSSDATLLSAGIACVRAHSSAPVELPRAVFSAKFRPMPGSSNLGRAEVSIRIESHAGDAELASTSEADHTRYVELVRKKYFGSNEATAMAERAAAAAVISATTDVEVDARYTPIGDAEMGRDGDRLTTTLRFVAGVFVRPI